MYILEIIRVNKTENLFFEDSNDYKNNLEGFEKFQKEFDLKYTNFFYKGVHNISKTQDRLENGSSRQIHHHKFFKTTEQVKQYWYDIFANNNQLFDFDENNERVLIQSRVESVNALRVNWQIEHSIFTEANILDYSGNFIECINSCNQKICIRFGECTPDKNCKSIHPDAQIFSEENVSYHHIPISSIKRIKK